MGEFLALTTRDNGSSPAYMGGDLMVVQLLPVRINRTLATVDQQASAFANYLLGLAPADAREAAGVMSPTSWLPDYRKIYDEVNA